MLKAKSQRDQKKSEKLLFIKQCLTNFHFLTKMSFLFPKATLKEKEMLVISIS